MEPGSTGQFIVLFILLCLSAFFSSSETALTSISKIKLKGAVKDGTKGAKDVENLTDNTDKLLSAILIGNNMVNVTMSSLAASLALRIAGNSGAALGVSTVIVTVLILIFGEITPKTLAARDSERVAYAVAKPIKFIVMIFTPFVMILNKITGALLALTGSGKDDSKMVITEAELKTMVDLSHEEGVIESGEKLMINNVFDFGDSKAEEVMTPRTDIVAVAVDASYDDIMAVFKEEHFTRMPVYDDDIDHIIGILNFKDFIFSGGGKKSFDVKNCMRKPFFSYENKETSQLFAQMRQAGTQIAVILDEYGGTAGLVTIEDLMEEIVGEIEDEYDEEDDKIIRLGENEYLVDGMLKIDEFSEATGIVLVSEDYQSIGGYVIGLIDDFPKQGDVITSPEVTFVVEKAEKNRIEKIRAIINTHHNLPEDGNGEMEKDANPMEEPAEDV